MGGPAAAASGVVGLVVGHGWWWSMYGGTGGTGSWERLGRAPAWVKYFVSDGPQGDGATSGGATGSRSISGVHVMAPRGRPGAESSSSASTSGYQWGSGQRLGSS
jgi:Derlin-2/3